MTTAVVDTNVLASGVAGFRDPASTPGQLLRAWEAGHFELVVSEHILTELVHTFEDSYFRRRLTPRQMTQAHVLFQRRATLTPITLETHGVATHPEDDLVLATAISAEADYLVTGDTMLQKLGTYEGVTIVSPREFVEMLEAEREHKL